MLDVLLFASPVAEPRKQQPSFPVAKLEVVTYSYTE